MGKVLLEKDYKAIESIGIDVVGMKIFEGNYDTRDRLSLIFNKLCSNESVKSIDFFQVNGRICECGWGSKLLLTVLTIEDNKYSLHIIDFELAEYTDGDIVLFFMGCENIYEISEITRKLQGFVLRDNMTKDLFSMEQDLIKRMVEFPHLFLKALKPNYLYNKSQLAKVYDEKEWIDLFLDRTNKKYHI